MGVLLLVVMACVIASVPLALKLKRASRSTAVLLEPAALPALVSRRTAGWRWAGVIGGLVAGGAAAAAGALGRGLLLAAPVFGLCVLAGVVVGETSVRSPTGRTRMAALEVRRVRDYLPKGLASAVAAAATLLVALLTVTTATGTADDVGRAGRILLLQCTSTLQQGAGPWPGSFYSVPLAALVGTGVVAASAALRIVVRRPRSGADSATVAADDALRRRAARTITGACGIVVTLPLAGACLLTAVALLSLSCRPTWSTFAGWSLLALLPALIALTGWCTASVLSPARRA